MKRILEKCPCRMGQLTHTTQAENNHARYIYQPRFRSLTILDSQPRILLKPEGACFMSLLEIPAISEAIATSRNPALYLDKIWSTYFADVARINQVEIAYCQPWKRRLGL